jgi:hypothetical protein
VFVFLQSVFQACLGCTLASDAAVHCASLKLLAIEIRPHAALLSSLLLLSRLPETFVGDIDAAEVSVSLQAHIRLFETVFAHSTPEVADSTWIGPMLAKVVELLPHSSIEFQLQCRAIVNALILVRAKRHVILTLELCLLSNGSCLRHDLS